MPCANPRPAFPMPEPLIQIRQGYSARYNGLVLSVESGVQEWTATVTDAIANETLYLAQRWNADAAMKAAVEFATFANPAHARSIAWTPFW